MISLEEIDQVIQSGPFEPTWDSPIAIKSVRIGIGMPNLECLSTGVSTVYLPLVQNGIPRNMYTRESCC